MINLPACPKSDNSNPQMAAGRCPGVLLPLSDYGPDGAAVTYKAWVCSNSACGHTIRVDKGQVTYETVKTGNGR